MLTVSKKPAAGGQFRTITEALDEVRPGMTIQVLDDAVYEGSFLINRPEHRDVVLEASRGATLRQPGKDDTVKIVGVSGFTLRGFRLESSPGMHPQVWILGYCPGVVLDRLDMRANGASTCVESEIKLLLCGGGCSHRDSGLHYEGGEVSGH